MSYISPFLMKSFATNRGVRGVHFYDADSCEFLKWDETLRSIDEKFPEKFAGKLIEAIANYDPNNEFVTVTAGGGQLTIEMFKGDFE